MVSLQNLNYGWIAYLIGGALLVAAKALTGSLPQAIELGGQLLVAASGVVAAQKVGAAAVNAATTATTARAMAAAGFTIEASRLVDRK